MLPYHQRVLENSRLRKHGASDVRYSSKGVDRMKRHSPVNVVFYFPATEPAKAELEQRVAQIHADAVSRRIGALHCAHQQKKALLDAVIEAAKKHGENRENTLDSE
jgi:hypothetical protein